MKAKLTALLVLFMLVQVKAQKLKFELKEKPPYKIGKRLLVNIYLVNNTQKPLTYFDSRGTTWDSFKSKFTLTIDNQPVQLPGFFDGHEGRFTEKTIITLPAGQTRLIAGRLLSLKSAGTYQVNYWQKQGPELVVKKFAKNSTAYQASQKINTFEVKGAVQFKVANNPIPKVTQKLEMTWKEWQLYRKKLLYKNRNHFSNLNKALENPNKVYSLQVWAKGLTRQSLLKIVHLSNLRSLNITGFNLDSFPEEFTQLKLYELTINNAQLQKITFPAKLGNLKGLKVLKLEKHSHLPPAILQLTQLETFEFGHGQLPNLPDLGNIKDLKKLRVTSSGLSSIAQVNWSKLSQLTDVNLGYNKSLNDITPLIQCKSIEQLRISSCGIQKLPTHINRLEKLKKLYCSSNKNLSDITPLMTCHSLELLNITRCNVRQIPDKIGNLTQLKQLSVSTNNLVSLPANIGKLKNLEKLSISKNPSLKTLPLSIVKLRKLKSLNLYKSGIKVLPKGLSQLPLTYVNVKKTPCKSSKDYEILKKRLGRKFRH